MMISILLLLAQKSRKRKVYRDYKKKNNIIIN